MPGKRADVFLELMHRIEYFSLDRACGELTDEEFYWEPAPGSWSIRARDECRTTTPFGKGDWLVDFEAPEPTPAPMTSYNHRRQSFDRHAAYVVVAFVAGG